MAEKSKEDKLDLILEMMMEMRKEIKEYGENMVLLNMENEELKQNCAKINKENAEIKQELKTLKENFQYLEKEKRKNNIIITGKIVDNNSVTPENVKHFIKEKLGTKANVQTVRKIGENKCLVELVNTEEKEKIMENKSKLKKLKERIYINHDLTKNEREIQKQLRLQAQEARRQGKMAKVGKNSVQIGNEIWKWNRSTNKVEKSKN